MGDQKYPEEVLCHVNSVYNYNYNSDAGTVVASAEFEVRVILLT